MERDRDPQPKPLNDSLRSAIAEWYREYTGQEQERRKILNYALWNITCQKLIGEAESLLKGRSDE